MRVWMVRAGSIGAAVATALFVNSTALATSLDAGAIAVDRAERGAEQTRVIAPPVPVTAQYRLTLSIDWTSTTHPGTLPPNAHVSGPVVAVHSTPGAMFRPGALASPGIESMAERGGVSTLLSELRATPGVTFTATDTPVFGTDNRSFTFTVDQNAHLVSLTTMVAPSPDWFVGVADRDLFVDGAWVEAAVVPLGNYDAGTDSGSDFTSRDADTRPPTVISGPADAAFVGALLENPLGSVLIERIG